MLDQTRQPEEPPKLTFAAAQRIGRFAAVPNTAAATDTQTVMGTDARASEPLATLKSYRHRRNRYADGVMFGAYMGVEGTSTTHVGDRLTLGHQPVDPGNRRALGVKASCLP